MNVDATALGVFAGLFLVVSVMGFAAVRWRRAESLAHLDEWGLGGRSFGGFAIRNCERLASGFPSINRGRHGTPDPDRRGSRKGLESNLRRERCSNCAMQSSYEESSLAGE